MPFPMRIQPLDSQAYRESIRNDLAKPVLKSRLKRLFDRQLPSVLRISSAEKTPAGDPPYGKDGGSEFEPSSVCLAKMVQNFIEETNEKPSAAKCGRNRCNCFNGNINDSSDDEFDVSSGFGETIPTASYGDSLDFLKSLTPCASITERNLLADTSKIVEKNKNCKQKDDLRKIVTDSLLLLGHDASICKSRWEKSPSYPAGEYEYIDVLVDGERVIVDIDFRSEFEIARSTGSYKAILQSLPHIFVGRADRLQQIVSITSEAARQSLKKKGMHIPPWRKADYMRAKWLSSHTRTTAPPPNDAVKEINAPSEEIETDCGDFELIFGEKTSPNEEYSGETESSPSVKPAITSPWQPPAIERKSCERGAKVITGLASLLQEKP
ncbi:Guanylate kinase [Actinidia chinensis var. chinensis]|uniref:Guanylate kinase n=1 Tax=Actinidia chinensis var. chinensis TaxID=1590841 RepID=A0A2R6Q3G7_ACTCC|nr:Guanylate kinase [Actinidia chinensis var. chinensis]